MSTRPFNEIRADLASTQIDKRSDEVCCPGWWYATVRHVLRNMDIDCGTHGEYGPEPDEGRNCGPNDRYDGEAIARLLADVPELLAALTAAGVTE